MRGFERTCVRTTARVGKNIDKHNTLLLASIALTALCGMAMSAHALPFLYGMLPVPFAFFDYDKSVVIVFSENLAMLTAFAAFGACAAALIRAFAAKKKRA